MVWFRRYAAAVDKRQKLVDEKWEDAFFSIISSKEVITNDIQDFLNSLHDGDEDHEKHFTNAFISNKESPHFFFTWNYLQESVRGDAKARLNTFAQKLAVEEKAIRLLKSPFVKNRILAVNTLGNLGAQNSYDKVLKFAHKKDPIISVWAFRAMFRIRPEKTRDDFLHLIAERKDWSPAYVGKILKDQGSDLVSKKLVEITKTYYENNLDETQMSRLVSYLKFAHVRDYSPVIEKLLSESDQMEVLIACMRLLKTEDSLPQVRKFLKDERWQLRMFAVMTLGRFEHREDIKHFISTLNDLNWWVRYYSARSLMSMPALTKNNIRQLSRKLPNEFQRDILKQVLAEDEFQCLNHSSSILSN